MKSKWLLRNTKIDIERISRETNLSPTVVKILIHRGIMESEDIKKFIEPSVKDLHNPFLMQDMDKGTEIIKDAIEKAEKICIYGDYDADGVTSTAILYKALKACGADVKYHVPDRESEGYGMNCERIKKLNEEGINVILTCDNGISCTEEVKLAKELGMTVVITDHHELPFIEENGNRKYVLPEANAVINPKRKDCNYPFKLLCGAGIAFKFAEVLFQKLDVNYNIDEYIELAGIGTICDIVDLIDENRIIAKKALEQLNKTSNLGLKCLIEHIGCKSINSYTIGFQIGPCINATGRLENASLSVELLLCNEEKRAKELAEILYELNKKRQDITNENVEEIIESIEKSSMKDQKVFLIYKENVHESIAGIVAGKIKEKYNVPTIVLTKGKEMPKGSGRSIEEYNLFEELIKCKEYIYKFGGHPMAAGLSIEQENIPKLREALLKNCSLTDEDIIPKIRIDKRLPLREINFDIINQIKMLEPFGKGNPAPVLAEKNIPVKSISILGKDKNTLKLRCISTREGNFMDALGFGKVEEFMELLREEYGDEYLRVLENPQGLKVDLIFSPFKNSYMDRDYLQLKINDIRLSN
ncbi:single-stranded-DNA-specific exonuclease RecJ [Haloimpatiens lingqiaonensis]|uniref:single-stranded-DNA-specific exonuclease RecJ n=1 Tax=Haloimpatiens lingqiaonensis TaxID=1380675 RepID=UPI0010FD0E4A|nr:single-stranded-DNA-specific exonuclease RecJ [Haloimpatiens lingqiaonensis]